MKVAYRIYLTITPAIVGLIVVAGLAYWGQYEHQVPEYFLIIAAAATVASIALSWLNARYIAQRIEKLAPPSADGSATGFRGVASALIPPQLGARRPDEIDAIEGVVDQLSQAVAAAEAGRTANERALEERTREYAALLSTVATAASREVEEIRLPLHILLENRFGDLNENQEEMLGAARTAAEAADAELVALRQIAELDLGTRPLRRDRFLTADLVRALQPLLHATAANTGHSLAIDLDPMAPAIRGDRPQLQEALSTLLVSGIRDAEAGGAMTLAVAPSTGGARIALSGAQRRAATVRGALANRIVAANGGAVSWEGGDLVVTLPGAGAATER